MLVVNILKDGTNYKYMTEYIKLSLVEEGDIVILTNHCNIKGIINKNSTIEIKNENGEIKNFIFEREKILKLNDNICHIL